MLLLPVSAAKLSSVQAFLMVMGLVAVEYQIQALVEFDLEILGDSIVEGTRVNLNYSSLICGYIVQ